MATDFTGEQDSPILVVDNDESTRNVLKDILFALGHKNIEIAGDWNIVCLLLQVPVKGFQPIVTVILIFTNYRVIGSCSIAWKTTTIP